MDNDEKTTQVQSAVKKQSFFTKLSRIFGFQKTKDKSTVLGSKLGVDAVKVDLDSPEYRMQQASLGTTANLEPLSTTVGQLLEHYLTESSLSYDDVNDRITRINKLFYMYTNDTIIKRDVDMVADEATQLDQQDRLITIESDNKAFVYSTYKLLGQWGVTQTRLHDIAKNLELYGEGFWMHPISEKGIECIKPLDPAVIKERLEFNGAETAKHLAQMLGNDYTSGLDRAAKIKRIIDTMSQDNANIIVQMMESKLFGYELEGDLFVPAWTITHFRLESDEFYPYGRPPLLECFSAFDQCFTAYALQNLARSQAFPTTVFKVKTMKSGGPAKQADYINEVRQSYDNLGLSPASEGNEPFTINTKIWVPEDLISVESVGNKSDYNFTDDLQLLENRVAFGAGIPKAYLDGTYNGFGQSGISLLQQYKPFARHVYTIQSAIIQGLGEMIREHYAVTNEFDYNIDFAIKMKFPAQETDTDTRTRQTSSLELTKTILDTIKTSLGLGDEDVLPSNVVQDIMSKYSFLDPTDIKKWIQQAELSKPEKTADDEEGGGGDGFGESAKRKSDLNRLREQRLTEISRIYENVKDTIFLNFLRENNMTDYENTRTGEHVCLIKKIDENSSESTMFNVIHNAQADGKSYLRESSKLVRLGEHFHVPEETVTDYEDN